MGDLFSGADETITAMLNAIETLDESSKELLAGCTQRDFNIGFECGDEPFGFYQEISTNTLSRIAAIGAGVVITIYPADPDRES